MTPRPFLPASALLVASLAASLAAQNPPVETVPADTMNPDERTIGRVLLGSALAFAGIAHLTFARREFQAQVPEIVPGDPDTVVVASGLSLRGT